MEIRHTLLLTVVGPLLALAGDKGLIRLQFLREAYEYRTRAQATVDKLAEEIDGDSRDSGDSGAGDHTGVRLIEDRTPFLDLARQLGEYFCGQRQEFEIPLDLHGSRFQLATWRHVRAIPFGRLRTYRQIARRCGNPDAARAVGQAVGANPVPILVPCHRVVGSDGKLVGFGGGLSLKGQLLRLEGHTLGERPQVVAPRLF